MKPGEIIVATGDIILNEGRETPTSRWPILMIARTNCVIILLRSICVDATGSCGNDLTGRYSLALKWDKHGCSAGCDS